MKSLKHLKAGDKVVRIDQFSEAREIKTIEKVTPSGLLKIDAEYYYISGRQRGGWHHIEAATTELMQEIADNDLIDKTLRYMRNVETLTIEQAQAIAEILTQN